MYKNRTINILQISSVLIGTFVGAGFASGQEILQYFVRYGKIGVFSAFLSCLIFTLFCYCTMKNADQNLKNAVLKYISIVFMFVMFWAMITASGEVLKIAVGAPKLLGSMIVSAFCCLIIFLGGEAFVKLNMYLTPIMILGIILIFLHTMYTRTLSTMSCSEVLGSAFVYVSYNTITLSAVVEGMRQKITDNEVAWISSVSSGMVLFLLIICMFYILYGFDNVYGEIPILDALSPAFAKLYSPILIMAMITTAVSNGYGAINSIGKNKIFWLIFMLVLSVVFSVFKFSFVVEKVYGLFGVLGLGIMANNFLVFIKNAKNKENKRKQSKIRDIRA